MQLELIHESIEDAVREVAKACGGTKAISQHLWYPSMTAQAAHTRFFDCLNPDRPHKFSPSELIAIGRMGREAGCDAVANFLASEMGYEKPKPAHPEKLRDELRERIARGLEYYQANFEALKRLGG